MEPPSKDLIRRLSELRICTPGDLRRCRGRVRRLAHDLPAFDSVWIDALLQERRLTPFQARLLDSPEADRLQIGPCLLIDQLGSGPSSVTYLARHQESNELCVLKVVEAGISFATVNFADMETLLARVRDFSHASIVLPKACLQHKGGLIVVSRYVPGHSLRQLLVRRGRFPAPVVAEIARQLLDGLAALERGGLVHGDIRPGQVRLTAQGTAVLVESGIAAAMSPELTIHHRMSLERCDCVAPELIGTGRQPESVSDLYSLGCLLWELLAGRAPFPAGDPLAKLAAHQTRDIPDIRDYAPDTPDWLAAAIRTFTARDFTRRPQSLQEVAAKVGRPRRAGRRRLRKFLQQFSSTTIRKPVPAAATRGGGMLTAAVLVFMLSGVALTLFDYGARTELLALVNAVHARISAETTAVAPEHEPPIDSRPSLEALPAQNTQGVIELTTAGPFEAAEIRAVGPITIRGVGGVRPVIEVRQSPLTVTATQFQLENVSLRGDAASGQRLLDVHAQEVRMVGIRVETTGDAIGPAAGARRILNWTVLNGDVRDSRLTVENAVFFGAGPAIHIEGSPAEVQIFNSLKIGSGPLLSMDGGSRQSRSVVMRIAETTLRNATSLIRMHVGAAQIPGRLQIDATDCVFDLSGPSAALIQMVADDVPASWAGMLEFGGEGSMARPGVTVSNWLRGESGPARSLGDDFMSIEGLTVGEFDFAGPLSADPRDSAIGTFQAPRLSPRPPGIVPARMDLAGSR